MLWICQACTTAYSVDAPRCPQCGSTDYREQGAPEEGATAEIVEDEEDPTDG